MKTRLAILKPLIVLCCAFATTAVFGQVTQIWDGHTDSTNMDIAGDYVSGTLPNTANNDTAEWNGLTTTNLFLINNTTAFASGPGNSGINLYLTANQTNPVNINTTRAVGQGLAVYNVTIDADAGSLSLGGTDSSHLLYMPQRPSGALHTYLNNSTNAATINPWVRYISGGGSAYTFDFAGTGNWIINNYLQPDNGGGAVSVQVDGPGTTTWTPAGYFGTDAFGTITVNGGKLVLAGAHSKLNSRPFTLNAGTFEFNAPGQAQTLGGVISGGGTIIVTAGTLTLQAASTYTGDTILNGGELIVNSAENITPSGPLGVGNTISFNGGVLGYSANNTFDYSSRFSTAPSQIYFIDTAAQNVTFATALISSGGTLIKTNAGTLTLSGANTYNGLTTVAGGKLVIQGSAGAGAITVADGTALGITERNGAPISPSSLTLGTTASAILEFNNVTNLLNPPLAVSGAVSAAGGAVTVNINSGTFNTIGQIFPLFSWGSGSAPAVNNPPTVSGAAGILSTNGNSIVLTITSTPYVWTGTNNDSWDFASINWDQSGVPLAFTNGVLALFDDSAAGTTNVNIVGVVQPASVTVNNDTLIYTITNSAGNFIGGNASLTKNGNRTLVLTGGANTNTGNTTINGGTVNVGVLANGGLPSDLGAASSSASSLVLNGGTLQYTGTGASIDRLFSVGTSGGTIDSSGAAALVLTNTGTVGLSGSGPRILTLAGSLLDTNTLAAGLVNSSGGATALSKHGPGKWVLTGNNTYSGVTHIYSGILQVGADGGSGTLGSGSIINDSTIDFHRTGSLTVSGAISGSGSVTNDGTGTVILAGNNGYQGGTTINAGTLQFGTGGASGAVFGNAPIVDNGTVIFNTTSEIDLVGFGNDLSGTGNVIVRKGLVTLGSGDAVTYTGWTEVDSGATFQPCTGQTASMFTSVITNNGTVKLVSQNSAPYTFGISNNIVGTGRVWMDTRNQNAGWAMLGGTNNTYTGGTFIGGGGIVLGDGVNPGSGNIVGKVIFTNTTGPTTATFTTNKRLLFNRFDDSIFTNPISSFVSDGSSAANSGSLEQMGPGMVTLTGVNSYPGDTTVDASATLQVGNGGTVGSIGSGPVVDNGTLVFKRSDNVTITNGVSGTGAALVQFGAGTLTLTASNSFTGQTIASNGTLVVSGGYVSGDLLVEGGAVASAPAGTVKILNIMGNMNIDSGTVLATLNKSVALADTNLSVTVSNTYYSVSNLVNLTAGTITATGGTLKLINAGPALAAGDKFTIFSGPVTGGALMTIVSPGFTVTNNLETDGSVTVTAVSAAPVITATVSGTSLNLSWPASWTGGVHLQSQTNTLAKGLGTNWVTIPGTDAANTYSAALNKTNATVFYRLIAP